MKFTKLFVLLFAVVAFVSCKKEEEKPADVIETTSVQKETVIVRDSTPPPPPPAKETSVKVSGNGVEVQSKDVQVEVKK